MSAEITAAVKRGGEAFADAWDTKVAEIGLDVEVDPIEFTTAVFREGMVAALDVPQMAAAIVDHLGTDTLSDDSETLVCACGHVLATGDPDDDRDPQAEHATHHAALIRTALLGADS